jgi:hypothetical protein
MLFGSWTAIHFSVSLLLDNGATYLWLNDLNVYVSLSDYMRINRPTLTVLSFAYLH